MGQKGAQHWVGREGGGSKGKWGRDDEYDQITYSIIKELIQSCK